VDAIAQLTRLLKSPEPELRCAAALVLGRLRPVAPATLRALGAALKRADGATRAYFLDALAATRSADVLKHVLPYLEKQGSASEQAVQIVWQLGRAALPAIAERHATTRGWLNGAYLKAVAGIRHRDAIKMVFDRLEELSWDQARATSLFLHENYKSYSKALQREVMRRLKALLARPDDDKNPNAIITALKLFWELNEGLDAAIVMPFTQRRRLPAVRRHALGALAGLVPPPAQVEALRPLLLPYLEERDEENVALPALDVIQRWAVPPLAAAELKRLAHSQNPAVVEWALQELLRRGTEGAVADVARLLESDRPRLRAAALTALREVDDGGESFVAALMAEQDERVREDMVEAVMDAPPPIAPERFAKLAKELARSIADDGRVDRALLVLLGSSDRQALNDVLVARARAESKKKGPHALIRLLQPVVRWRQATEEARVLLALANLDAAQDRFTLDDGNFKRCIDILSPLARTHGYDLEARLGHARTLTASQLTAVAAHLATLGPEERDVASAIVRRIDPTQLSESERLLYDRLATARETPAV
jgi:hypothetical protein